MSLYMFIAADKELPLLESPKIKRYKFKEGVKCDLDENGKWYFYTNDKDKNSSDLLIPCAPGEGADTIIVDSLEDHHDLEIYPGVKCDDITIYTKKSYIYTISFRFNEERAERLVNYLRENMKPGDELELWSIWLGEEKEAVKYSHNIDALTAQDIGKVFDYKGYINPECIILSRCN